MSDNKNTGCARLWVCPECKWVTELTYEDLAEIGNPICNECDCEMVLEN